MNSRHELQGIWPVLITPYNDDLKIDIAAYREMIRWHLGFELGGIYANCLSSEMFKLEEAEKLLLIREAVKMANGKVPVAATGNFGNNINAHIEFCKKVADAGADVVMLTIPAYIENDDDLETYFFQMAEACDMPLGLYECPVPRYYYIGIKLLEKLANSGRFFAYKETSCDIDKIKQVIHVCKGTELTVLQANVPYMLDSMKAGAAGSMNVVANWLPDLTIEVLKRGMANDPSVLALNNILCAMELAQRSIHPQGVKYLMAKRGLPIKPLTRYPKQLTKEEARSLDLVSQMWFETDGSLKILEGVKL